MAASDHMNPRQLAMFMRASDIAQMPSAEVLGGAYLSSEEQYHQKAKHLRESGMGADVAKHGVQEPVEIAQSMANIYGKGPDAPALMNGHHRLVAQLAANPSAYVPVVHHADFDGWANYQNDRYRAGVREVHHYT